MTLMTFLKMVLTLSLGKSKKKKVTSTICTCMKINLLPPYIM